MFPKKARRIVLIDTRFQLRLAGAFLVLQVILTWLFGFGLYLFMDSELKTGLASAHASYRSLEQMLLPIVLVLAAFSLALSTAMVTGFVVILSHRIAGPLFRFRTVLEDLASRRLPTHTQLRPDDQLVEVATSLGRAVDTLASDLSALHAAAAELRQAAAPLQNSALDAAVARLDQTLASWQCSS